MCFPISLIYMLSLGLGLYRLGVNPTSTYLKPASQGSWRILRSAFKKSEIVVKVTPIVSVRIDFDNGKLVGYLLK